MYSLKIFHNGAIQLTGVRDIQEAVKAMAHIVSKIQQIDGIYAVNLKDYSPDKPYVSHDLLVYSRHGRIVGFKGTNNMYYINGEYLTLCETTLPGDHVLVSASWSAMSKMVYTLDGEYIGKYKLQTIAAIPSRSVRKDFTIKDGLVFDREKQIGSIRLVLEPNAHTLLSATKMFRSQFPDLRHMLVKAQPFDDSLKLSNVDDSFFEIHNINTQHGFATAK
ncbi:hypothetical protein GGF31_003444 [Allomyces arbusculus]|nr:hypothetical protein GGF31_003444 [Allomyces arbusculus]